MFSNLRFNNQSYNGNALSTFTPSLGVTPFTKLYWDVLGANGFHCFRSSSSLHVSFISRVLLVLPTSLYYSLDLNCTPVHVCWLRFTRKHAGIPSRQTSLWTSFIHLPLLSPPPHRLLRRRYRMRFARTEPADCPVHGSIVTCDMSLECPGHVKIG